jgi:hypothetical protein
MPFVWIGVNPVTIYLGGRFIDFEAMAKLFVGGPRECLLMPLSDAMANSCSR